LYSADFAWLASSANDGGFGVAAGAGVGVPAAAGAAAGVVEIPDSGEEAVPQAVANVIVSATMRRRFGTSAAYSPNS
jgi:hypothetical protein